MLKDAESKMWHNQGSNKRRCWTESWTRTLTWPEASANTFCSWVGNLYPECKRWRFAPRLSSAIFGNLPALQNKLKTCKELGRVRDWRTFQAVRKRVPDTYSDSNECLLFCNLAVLRHSLAHLLRRFDALVEADVAPKEKLLV